jgi:alpha-L-arabinofuranosidase
MSCQFRKSEMIPLDALDGVIQDALDLIEFANGAPDTPWGKVRAEMGRTEPFNMRMLGVGNENWGMEFIERYEIIYKGIKAKHPEIEIVSSSGAGPAGPEYDLAWDKIPKIGADWIDEHYYVPADWLFNNTGRYDNFNRKGPKVYVGEYACHLPNRANSLFAALAEAAMMTGFERNSDIVGMTAYAPLFSKIGSTQWVPDLIWFTNGKSYGTPSYHVQKLFGANRPSVLLPTESYVADVALPAAGGIGLQTWSGSAEFKDIRVTRGAETLYTFDPARGLDGWSKPAEGHWEVVDGALRQTHTGVNRTTISTGSPGWQDYSLRLKARKLSGQEGFIVRVRDQGNRFVHVNFGGWSNSQHGIEQNGQNPLVRKPGSIETNRWYDVEISLNGDRVSASLDGVKLFDQVPANSPPGPKVEFVSGYDKKTGEIVIKCVNAGPETNTVALVLQGAKIAPGKARRITLTGDPDAINDLANPDRVSPVEDQIELSGSPFKVTLPASSLTILRCRAQLVK